MGGESFTMPPRDDEAVTHYENHTTMLALQLGSIGIGAIQEAYKQLCNSEKAQSLDLALMKLPFETFITQCIILATATLSHVKPGQYKLKDVHDLLASITGSDHNAMQLFDKMLTENKAFINNMGHVIFTVREHLPNQRTVNTST